VRVAKPILSAQLVARSATPGASELAEDFASESGDLSEGQLRIPSPGWRSLGCRRIRRPRVSGSEGMANAIDSTGKCFMKIQVNDIKSHISRSRF
jgi:hypothetical protein